MTEGEEISCVPPVASQQSWRFLDYARNDIAFGVISTELIMEKLYNLITLHKPQGLNNTRCMEGELVVSFIGL